MKIPKLTKVQREFFEALAFENPEPSEPWNLRDNWDPRFPLSIIDAMTSKGLIETRGDRHGIDFAYRFTPSGRTLLRTLEQQK